jgi:hypothetical protein
VPAIVTVSQLISKFEEKDVDFLDRISGLVASQASDVESVVLVSAPNSCEYIDFA